MDGKLDVIGEEVKALKRTHRAQAYPRELRSRVTELARDWIRSGRSLRELGRALGIRAVTLERWCDRVGDGVPAPRLVPVHLVSGRSRPSVEAMPATVTMISPSGWRLEGLRVTDAVALLERIG